MVEEGAVAAELVQDDPVIAGEPDRVGGVSSVGQREGRPFDPSASRRADAVGVDLDPVGRTDAAAMVDRGRKRRPREVAGERKSHPLAQPEKIVAVHVRIHGREVVRSGVEVEVAVRRLRRGGNGRLLVVDEFDDVSSQRLDVIHRSVQSLQRRRHPHRIELGVVRARRRTAVRRLRVDREDHAGDVVDEGAQVDGGERSHLEDRDPVEPPTERRQVEPEVDFEADVVRSFLERARNRWKRQPRQRRTRLLAEGGVRALESLDDLASAVAEDVVVGVPVHDKLLAVDRERLRATALGAAAFGAAGDPEPLRERLGIDRFGPLDRRGVRGIDRDLGVSARLRAHHPERARLHLYGEACLPDRQ
jgi:hypothetical protein